MENKKQKSVLIGMSGGVDSSVAALLLKKQGYKVIGAFMINFSGTKNKLTNECSYIKDKKDAEKIASILEIPLIILNFEKEYRLNVLNKMFKSYSQGLTPNPDSLCNKMIKFSLLWREAKRLGCDFIATGHYIKKIKTGNKHYLKIPKDKSKDQSYFLYDLTQKDLEHTLFPIADYTKLEVREIAKKNELPNWDKHGTRGICFVGKRDMKLFLQQKIKPKLGNIVSSEGEIIGQHKGMMFFTIGERIGENQNTTIFPQFRNKYGKLYVAEKNKNPNRCKHRGIFNPPNGKKKTQQSCGVLNPFEGNKRKNIIVAVPKNHKSLYKKEFQIIKINWINEIKLPLDNVKVRIRHLGQLTSANIIKKQNKIICLLKKPIKSVAEGQSCVVYKNNLVLGGGEIRYP